MRNGFWNSISRIVITSSLVIGAHSAINGSSLYGQDVVQDQSGKKIKEPVFRVSKFVEGSRAQATNLGEQVANQFVEQNKVGPQAIQPVGPVNQGSLEKRVADARGLPAGSMIPGAGVTGSRSLPRTETPGARAVIPGVTPIVFPAATKVAAPAPHPLDRAVAKAYESLETMRTNVSDYTAIMAKREQINGRVGSPSFMQVKFRCPRQLTDGSKQPFSIYMKFLKPRDSAGREVIWVDGQNSNNIVAHEAKGTLLGSRNFNLNPTGFLAMKGQRYPIFDAGIENLILKLIEKAERDRLAGDCIVNYRENANINNRKCDLIELIHNDKRAPYEFHKAQVFIDSELNIPIRYAAFDWPASPGSEPVLLEEYTYLNVSLNVGLTDNDFSLKNKAYGFKRR